MLLFKRAQLCMELTVSFKEFRRIWYFGSRKKNIAYQRFFLKTIIEWTIGHPTHTSLGEVQRQ